MTQRHESLIILGSGTAGLNAFKAARMAGKRPFLINAGPTGTTCARVGCMPSKVALQSGKDFHRRHALAAYGILGGEQLSVDTARTMDWVRTLRDRFVDRVRKGSTDTMGDRFLSGYASLVAPGLFQVGDQHYSFDTAVVATGSSPILPPSWAELGERVITTDQFFELPSLPKRMAVIGLGVIGLELGQFCARMGVEVFGYDALDTIGGCQDPLLREQAIAFFRKEMSLTLGQPVDLTANESGITVHAGGVTETVDLVLVAIGRRPAIGTLNLGVYPDVLDDKGRLCYHPETLQLGSAPLFGAGDVLGDRPVLHEASAEGKVAGANAAGADMTLKRWHPFGIVFTDPNIATVGTPFSQLEDPLTGKADFRMNGRAIQSGQPYGGMHLYVHRDHGHVLGATFFCPGGEHLAHTLLWWMETAGRQGATIRDLAAMPFYHPVLEEGLQSAIQDAAAQWRG